jgi:hypothetical protein
MRGRLRCAVLVIAILGASFLASTVAWAVPNQPFEDCGTIIQGVECRLFDSDNFGVYVVTTFADFNVGDRVMVTGQLNPDCITFCQQGDGCIENASISPCPGEAFEDCGTIIQGVECRLFDSDNFGVYVVTTFAGFNVGDRVLVTGTYNPYCVTVCMQGDGCIENATVVPCPYAIPTLTEWGLIIFSTLLFAWMAWMLVRRRRRATVGV